MSLEIRFAQESDVKLILEFIRGLAVYEKLAHEVVADEGQLRNTLFGKHAYAEVLLAFEGASAVGFALFFHNYSTFLGKPGIHLEDLFVPEKYRGRGYGKALLKKLARITVERDCGRLEWAVLDWNKPAIEFYESIEAKAMDEWITYRMTGDTLIKFAK